MTHNAKSAFLLQTGVCFFLYIKLKGGEHMTIYERLDEETRRKFNAKRPAVHRRKHKHKEKLSTRDIEELMGVRRDTYKRVGGKVKRK